MLRTIHIGACALLAAALGCTQSYKPITSTETGNPPVTIDSAKIALVVTRDEVHVRGEEGAVMPSEADVEITIVRTRDVTLAEVDNDGSFDAEVDATLDDVFEVRAVLDGVKSDVVIVVRGGSEVVESDGGALSCEQQTSLGSGILEDALATADRACESAADCSPFWRSASCIASCFGGYYSDEGMRSIADAVAAIDDGVCASFADDGCTAFAPPCPPPPDAACVEGQCVEDNSIGGECDTCFDRELTWRTTGGGILPALPAPGSHKLSACNALTFANAVGEECVSEVVQCGEPAVGVSIAAVLSALAHDDVVQAFERGGTHGYAPNEAGYTYELTLDGQTITYRTCAGPGANVSCDPPNGLDELIALLSTLGSEHSCTNSDLPADCSAPFDAGDCDAAMNSWWHDPRTGACIPRTYGGCGGNDNRYDSVEACRTACPPPSSESGCPPNRVLTEDVCFECGPVGGCDSTTSACLLTCSEDMHCEAEAPSMGIEPTCTSAQVCLPQLFCE